jgi:two-component system nitrate/nitrite response regulator NarL
MPDLRTLILAEDPLARAGLVALLQNEDGITIIGQTNPLNDNMDVFLHDIALIDMGWELDDNLTALADSALLDLDTPLLVLLPDDERLTEVMPLLYSDTRTAAFGVLLRSTSAERIIAALHAINTGLVLFDPAFTPSLNTFPSGGSIPDAPLTELTPREREVLNLLAEGLPNKTIARQLTISEYTVKFHVNSILSKLNAGSRTEAVVRATRLGLITL